MVSVVRHAFVAGVVVTVGTLLLPRDEGGPKRRGRIATAPVIVAAMEIPEGARIDRTAVGVAMWPTPTIPAGAYTSIDSVIGRVVRINVSKGEALMPARLAPHGTSAGLVVKVMPGKRAYSIRINDVTGIAGMILPNSRVDIVVTTNQVVGDRGQQPTSKILMSNVRVLAIAANVQRGADGRRINSHVATVETPPDETERLAIASHQGSLSLTLRADSGPGALMTNPPPDAAAVSNRPKPDTARVRTFRGTKGERVRLDSTRRPP